MVAVLFVSWERCAFVCAIQRGARLVDASTLHPPPLPPSTQPLFPSPPPPPLFPFVHAQGYAPDDVHLFQDPEHFKSWNEIRAGKAYVHIDMIKQVRSLARWKRDVLFLCLVLSFPPTMG